MKKKMSKLERKLQKSKEIYDLVSSEHGLNGTVNEQISQIIDLCCDIQCEICNNSDKIKIDNFDKAMELIHIDKATWLEFVNISAKKYYGRLNDKAVDKYEETCNSKRHIVNLKQSFYDSYLTDNVLRVVDENNKQTYNFDNEENIEFQTLMENSAKIRDYINNSLYKRYKTFYQCVYYLTEGEMKYGEFKDLVDWRYYENSGNEKYPDRAKKIFERFNRMIRLYNKYSNEKHNTQLSNMCKEFGINYSLSTPQNMNEIDDE